MLFFGNINRPKVGIFGLQLHLQHQDMFVTRVEERQFQKVPSQRTCRFDYNLAKSGLQGNVAESPQRMLP
jgi:hypothetical protein